MTKNQPVVLTEQDVEAIRYELPRAGFYVQQIAQRFGISAAEVVRIRLRQTYKEFP